MAEIPKLKRLTLEDFADLSPEVRQGLERFLFTLNPFLSDVSGALDRGLTFSANSAAVVREVEVTMPDPWEPLALLNGVTAWSAATHGVPACRKVGDRIVLSGLLRHNSSGGVADLASLPMGFEPASTVSGLATVVNNSWAALDVVPANRTIRLVAGGSMATSSPIGLQGLSFRVADPRPPVKAPFPLLVNVESLPGAASGCWALRCLDITDRQIAPGPTPTVSWEGATVANRPMVKLLDFGGLHPGRKYRVTVLVTA